MFIIAGLGNPGKEYSGTRHNVGYDAIDYLVGKYNLKTNKLKFNSVYWEIQINGEKVLLVKPVTYMNRSGISISEIVNYFKVPLENLIVIYDDIDIPVGALRIRPHGSAGTHNGMKSIINSLGNDKFPRIRIGIDRNPNIDLADYVLQRFTTDERAKIDDIIKYASEAAQEIIKSNLDSAMQKYNIRFIEK
ncbi:MAG: aminoacyl-tRNA hydrolase [Tissierellia bacterium]|nr:aminoacyl-tRNA hydrolase [Tissierellia bacterium]